MNCSWAGYLHRGWTPCTVSRQTFRPRSGNEDRAERKLPDGWFAGCPPRTRTAGVPGSVGGFRRERYRNIADDKTHLLLEEGGPELFADELYDVQLGLEARAVFGQPLNDSVSCLETDLLEFGDLCVLKRQPYNVTEAFTKISLPAIAAREAAADCDAARTQLRILAAV